MLEHDLYQFNKKFKIMTSIEEEDKEKFKNIVWWAGEMMDLTIKEKLLHDFIVKKGEIWTCNFGENVGSETNKIRPAVIIQNDIGNCKSPTTIIVPISSRPATLPTHTEILPDFFEWKESDISGTVLCEQIRSVSKSRLGRKIGKLNDHAMDLIHESIIVSLGMKDTEYIHQQLYVS